MASAYYDTCIFLICQNSSHRESAASARMVDVREIRWEVHMCVELSAAESTAREFIQNFEVACISNGIHLLCVQPADTNAVGRSYRRLKRELDQIGLQGRDWRHLLAAKAAQSEVFCSVDRDFQDPSGKRNPRSRRQRNRAQVLIENELELEVLLPSEFIRRT